MIHLLFMVGFLLLSPCNVHSEGFSMGFDSDEPPTLNIRASQPEDQTMLESIEEDNRSNIDGENTTVNYRQAIQSFSQNIFTEVLKDNPGNLVFSPFSLHVALSMLAHGGTANSTTRIQLLKVLGFVGVNRRRELTSLEQNFNRIFEEYRQEDYTVVTTANRVWTNADVVNQISPKFVEALKKWYNTDLAVLPHEDPENAVNNWVKDVTNGTIEKIVSSIDPNSIMLLTNAVYFKESWTEAFEELDKPSEFTLVDGSKVPVNMMTRSSHEIVTGSFKFNTILPNMKMTLVTLRYASDNGRFQMVLVMPNEHTGLQTLTNSLMKKESKEQIFETIHKAALEADLITEERSVIMPIFTLKSELEVENYLRNLGVIEAFSPEAKFGQISSNAPLKVTSINHVATVEVTVEGTSGAAATGLEIVPLSGLIDTPQEVILNKPFIFLIKDTLLETILFVGKYSDPTNTR